MAFDTSSQAKTLADMTADERQECIGMWCDVQGNGRLCILLQGDAAGADVLGFYSLAGAEIDYYGLKAITPRFDLPRAITNDGYPVEMVKEYGNGGWAEEVNEPYHWPMRSRACNEYCSPFDKAPAEYSRWVSSWEPVPTPRKINGMVNEYV